ncbi:MAG TPA: alkaline phosphatase family protein [Candidatus Cybelea sp.]|jgi:phospholipase C|nr:alkaline phosphatase family protein [Candidatus Cybelea sp.]
MNYPGATTATYGYDAKHHQIVLQPVTLATTWDLQHNAQGFIKSCRGTGSIPGTNCRMNGFDKQRWSCGGASGPACPNADPPYSYVPQSEVQPYWEMANQYVLADEMFGSDFDTSSFVSHQYAIAAVNPNSSVDNPQTLWGCPGGPSDTISVLGPDRNYEDGSEVPCWDPPTLGDELDGAGLSWAYYAPAVKGGGASSCGDSGIRGDAGKGRVGIWSAYQAIEHICYGPDWNADVISSSSRFLTDVGKGKLRAVTWITPTYANSDHGGSGSRTGPSWVAQLVNAVGESPFWNYTAIFIFWDESGGWFDPVAPAYVDNDGLGFRIPLLIISPYAKQGYVSHVSYEHGSILKFVEDQFGLGRLAASDARANSPQADCFDFSQTPRQYVPITSTYDRAYFMRQPADLRSPDSE